SISKLIALFPTTLFSRSDIEQYNDMVMSEFIAIRDFVVLHYKASQRDDSEFWNYCRTMKVPDGLQQKMELYQSGGRLFRENNELFDEVSWFAVMHGQGLRAQHYHPLVDEMDNEEFARIMDEIKNVVARS